MADKGLPARVLWIPIRTNSNSLEPSSWIFVGVLPREPYFGMTYDEFLAVFGDGG